MEVLLKKVKVTVSVLKQLQIASWKQMQTYEPLGYVVKQSKRGSYRSILLYDKETNTLVCMLAYTKVKLEEKSLQIDAHGTREQQWQVVLEGPSFVTNYNGHSNNKEAHEKVQHAIENTIEKALMIGQIFY